MRYLDNICLWFKYKGNLLLYISSLLICGFFSIGYLFLKPYEYVLFCSLSDEAFIVIFVSFIVLCNLQNLIGIIKSIVRDKISEQANIELIEKIKDKLKEDKNFLKDLVSQSHKNQEKESNVPMEDVNK